MSTLLPLKARGAATSRRGRVLVGPLDLTLEGDGITAVIGPNGAGKTTLLSLLHGTARLTRGTLGWSCSTEDARAAQAFVFQRPVMLRRSVLENIAYPLRIRRAPKARAQAADWATRVGLGKMLDRPAQVLSAGEQQKLALARALITGPRLLFLDEPTAALDGRATREIETILHTASADGTRVVLSTHDMGQARRLAREIWFLHGGQLVETAPADQFFAGPASPQAAAFLRGDIVE